MYQSSSSNANNLVPPTSNACLLYLPVEYLNSETIIWTQSSNTEQIVLLILICPTFLHLKMLGRTLYFKPKGMYKTNLHDPTGPTPSRQLSYPSTVWPDQPYPPLQYQVDYSYQGIHDVCIPGVGQWRS